MTLLGHCHAGVVRVNSKVVATGVTAHCHNEQHVSSACHCQVNSKFQVRMVAGLGEVKGGRCRGHAICLAGMSCSSRGEHVAVDGFAGHQTAPCNCRLAMLVELQT